MLCTCTVHSSSFYVLKKSHISTDWQRGYKVDNIHEGPSHGSLGVQNGFWAAGKVTEVAKSFLSGPSMLRFVKSRHIVGLILCHTLSTRMCLVLVHS
jgi:hypothetical protein